VTDGDREILRRWEDAASLQLALERGEVTRRRVELLAEVSAAAALALHRAPLPRPAEPPSADAALLLDRLAETFVWCTESTDGGDLHLWRSTIAPEDPLVVERLVSKRRLALGSGGWTADARARGPHLGRLVVFAPLETLEDGAAKVASGGLFDEKNVPAHDTWLVSTHDLIICWFPWMMLTRVGFGLRANPEQRIRWATPGDALVLSELEAWGFPFQRG
jgi:hypothetical protein